MHHARGNRATQRTNRVVNHNHNFTLLGSDAAFDFDASTPSRQRHDHPPASTPLPPPNATMTSSAWHRRRRGYGCISCAPIAAANIGARRFAGASTLRPSLWPRLEHAVPLVHLLRAHRRGQDWSTRVRWRIPHTPIAAAKIGARGSAGACNELICRCSGVAGLVWEHVQRCWVDVGTATAWFGRLKISYNNQLRGHIL